MMQQAQTALAPTASAASKLQTEQDARLSFAALLVGALIAIGSGGLDIRHQLPLEEGGGSATMSRPSKQPSAEMVPIVRFDNCCFWSDAVRSVDLEKNDEMANGRRVGSRT